jgi:hypothetical protein
MKRWLLLGLVVGLQAACTSTDETEDSSDAVIVHPGGTDLPGKLLIAAPAGATGVEPATYFRANFDNPFKPTPQ